MTSNFWGDNSAPCPKVRGATARRKQTTEATTWKFFFALRCLLIAGVTTSLGWTFLSSIDSTAPAIAAHDSEAPAADEAASAAPVDDPARDTLRLINSDGYESLEDIATGRLLDDTEGDDLGGTLRRILESLDEESLYCTRRGPSWVMCEAPYELIVRNELRSGRAQLRFVKDAGTWKLEHVRTGEIQQ